MRAQTPAFRASSAPGGVRVRAQASPVAAAPAVKASPKAPTHFDLGDGTKLPVPPALAPLFTPVKLGRFQLSNRIAYAPLTRTRATDFVPQPIMAPYYAQRTVPGTLMISEATNITAQAVGCIATPGLWMPEQLEGWKPVTRAVRDKGGVFFCQLWHTGRASHTDLQPGNATPVSSSAVPITSPVFQVFTAAGPKQPSAPRPLSRDEIKQVVRDYATAARNAVEVAGFDGVEVHAANGYLIDQFIKDSVNRRTDEYGGSIENRCRFALEVVQAVVEAVGADRVGIRISPFTTFNDAVDTTPYATHCYLVEQLNLMGLAYVHLIEPRIVGAWDGDNTHDSLLPFRTASKATYITAGGFTAETGAAAVAGGAADLVAFGRWYLANPDLHKRFLMGAPLNQYDRNTFCAPGPAGYTDYPTLDQLQAKGGAAQL